MMILLRYFLSQQSAKVVLKSFPFSKSTDVINAKPAKEFLSFLPIFFYFFIKHYSSLKSASTSMALQRDERSTKKKNGLVKVRPLIDLLIFSFSCLLNTYLELWGGLGVRRGRGNTALSVPGEQGHRLSFLLRCTSVKCMLGKKEEIPGQRSEAPPLHPKTLLGVFSQLTRRSFAPAWSMQCAIFFLHLFTLGRPKKAQAIEIDYNLSVKHWGAESLRAPAMRPDDSSEPVRHTDFIHLYSHHTRTQF